MHFIRAVSRTRAKVLQVRKPNKYMTRFFFFADAKTLKLPDDELITELKEDNPEWFN